MNIGLWIITGSILSFSFIKNKKKTLSALKKAYKKFVNILFLFLLVMAGFALVVTFLSPDVLQKYIGVESGIKGVILSLSLGSISVMPGFAAYPLCAALKEQGIPYYIIAAFSLSLMTVGVLTFPIEKKFLGFSAAIIRNILSLIVSMIAVFIIKIIFGE